ncbi:MAG: glycosyltransferase family 9 protein, partial [FCB group bacterium]|nr:glycosyltransferase family 9 protein [FCB group bacterium]
IIFSVNVVKTDTIFLAAKEISKCEYFIANDTGLMHLADILKIPTVAIFGMTNIYKSGPWNKPNEIISLNLKCSPCYKHGKIKCRNKKKYACMDIPLEIVLEGFEALKKKL